MPEKATSSNKNVSFQKSSQHQKTPNQRSKTKGQSNKPASAPVQLLVQRHEVGVKECLVWRSNSAKKVADPDTQASRREIFIPRKAELGRAKQRGYTLPEDDSANAVFKDTNGTVIEALRGWPSSQRPAKQSILDQYLEEQAIEDEHQRKLKAARQTNKAKSTTKTSKNKRKTKKNEEPLVVQLDESTEPVMPELISHRFLYENLVREAEERRARQALEEAENGSIDDGSGPLEVKSNRAAQLRAIHLGTKVTVSPKDLWQLSQFKNSAQSQLDTFRRAQRHA